MTPETATASRSKLAEGRGSAGASTAARGCVTKLWVSVLRSRAAICHGLRKSRSLLQPSDQNLKRPPLTRESTGCSERHRTLERWLDRTVETLCFVCAT